MGHVTGMGDSHKTKAELIRELEGLRARVAELERGEKGEEPSALPGSPVDQELGSTKNYLRTIFDHMHDAIFIHDAKGVVRDVNEKMLELYRCTREEAIGLSIIPDFSAPSYPLLDYHRNFLWKKVMAGEDQLFEWKARRPGDGSVFDAEVWLTRISLPEGHFILATTRDITDRKRVELELKGTREFLKIVLNNIYDAIYIHDIHGKIIDVNDKMLEMHQCAREEVIGYYIQDFSTPDNPLDEVSALWEKVMEGEDQFYEWKCMTRRGCGVLDMEVFLTKLSLPEGDFVLASVRDITERKRVQQELSATKDYLKTVFNKIHDSLFVHDLTGKVVDVNEKVLELYRCSREQALGLHILNGFSSPHRQVADHHRNVLWKKVMAGEDQVFEWKAKRPTDGTTFDVEVCLTKLSLPDGDFILASTRDITERKRVQQELGATKDYLKTVFNKIHDALFVHRTDGIIVDVNEKLLELYRCTREDAIGHHVHLDFSAPDLPTLAHHEQVLWKKVMAGEDQLFEWKAKRPTDGTTFDVEVCLTKLSLPDGDFILASTRDITERKGIERQLVKEREIFFSVMENNPHGIALFDRNGRFDYLNPEFTHLTGYTLEDIPTGHEWVLNAYPDPEYREKVLEFWRSDRLQEGRGQDVEWEVVRKNGEHKYVEFRVTYLGIKNLVVLTDTTARKRAEEELRAEKQKFQTLSENSPVGMMMVRPDDTVEYINPKWRELFGYNIEDVPTIEMWFMCAYPDPEFRREAFSKRMDDLKSVRLGEGRAYVRKVVCKDGARKYIHFIPVGLATGEILMTCEDITRSRETEEKIKERNLELEILNGMMASVSSSLYLPEILETLKKIFVERLDIPAGGVFVYDEINKTLGMEACWGVPDTLMSRFETFVMKGYVTGNVIKENRVTLVGNAGPFPDPEEPSFTAFLRKWHSYLCIPLSAKGENQGMIFLVNDEPGKLREDQLTFFQTLGQQVGVATQNALLFDEVRHSHMQMRALSLRLVEVQEAERRYVAKELHDEIGQELTGLKLGLEMNVLRAGDDLKESLNETISVVNKLLGLVRELSLNLRPAMLDDLGLLPTLPWHFDRFGKQTNIHIAFKHSGLNDRRFPLEVETAIYRIIQEALTNVARHAKVNEAVVRLWSDDKVLGVQIEDSGDGFDSDVVLSAGRTSGLYGMRERAVLLGGSFTIESGPGSGTRLTAELPICQNGECP